MDLNVRAPLVTVKNRGQMEKEFDIGVKIYRTAVHVVVTDQIEKYHEKLGLKSWDEGYRAFFLYDREDKLPYRFYLVLIDDFTVGELLHECIHCANRMLGSVGISLGHDDDEALTYLTQYIFEEVLKTLGEDEEDFSLAI